MRPHQATHKARPMLWLLLAVSSLAVVATQNNIDLINPEPSAQGELMYFPSSSFTKAATFGFTNLAADGIWLQVIQYYGRHSLSDREYKYLGHMFSLLSSLAPDFKTAYNFGALLLVTDGRDPGGAMSLLDKGIRQNPDDWSIPFTKGFINYVFLTDYREAGRWFTIASRQPDAPEMTGRFAAFALKKGGDIETSRELWSEIYSKSRNQAEREIAKKYIGKIDREIILKRLQQFADDFKQKNHRPLKDLRDLVLWGYVNQVPDDPLGGYFYWDAGSGMVLVKGSRKDN